MIQKKKYEKPAMQVFELKQQSQLLQVSGNDPFGNGGDPFADA